MPDVTTPPPAPLATDDAKKLAVDAIIARLAAPGSLADSDKVEFARRADKIDAGLQVVASITGALYALLDVLNDATFQSLLKDLSGPVRSAMVGALNSAISTLTPIFEGCRKLQDPTLTEKINKVMDAGLDIAYATAQLSDDPVGAARAADRQALIFGMVKNGGPLILACVDLLGCCLKALAGTTGVTASDDTKRIAKPIVAALETRNKARAEMLAQAVVEGRALLKQRNGAGATAALPASGAG
jgi:hypothetical protein